MVRIKIQGTKREIAILTKAARRTGFTSPGRFVAALFDGNHTSQIKSSDSSMPDTITRPQLYLRES